MHSTVLYDLDFTPDDIRSVYDFNETCQGSVPPLKPSWRARAMKMPYGSPSALAATATPLRVSQAALRQPITVKYLVQ
jgi:hypothetical protein